MNYRHEENALVKIFNDTRDKALNDYAGFTQESQSSTKIYLEDDFDTHIPNNTNLGESTPIDFVNGGTVSSGYSLVSDTNKVAILNFADALRPGGWVDCGAPTQEENICRCSNLFEIITQDRCLDLYYNYNKAYTSDGGRHWGVYTDRIIYSPNVLFFKDDSTYDDIKPMPMDVITCPAPSIDFYSESQAMNIYENRIRKIVCSAIENEVDTIVLGAWGCGAFGQDPNLIAKAFIRVLNTYNYYFKRIVFAIRPTSHFGDATDSYVMSIFERLFRANYIGEVHKDDL